MIFFKQNENIIDDMIKKAMNRERIFKLRAKADQYNVIEIFKYNKTKR